MVANLQPHLVALLKADAGAAPCQRGHDGNGLVGVVLQNLLKLLVAENVDHFARVHLHSGTAQKRSEQMPQWGSQSMPLSEPACSQHAGLGWLAHGVCKCTRGCHATGLQIPWQCAGLPHTACHADTSQPVHSQQDYYLLCPSEKEGPGKEVTGQAYQSHNCPQHKRLPCSTGSSWNGRAAPVPGPTPPPQRNLPPPGGRCVASSRQGPCPPAQG